MGYQRVRHNWETHTFTSLLFVLGIQLISVKGTIYMSIPKETVLLRILFNSNQFAYKGLYSQSYGFSRNHVWMWELDHKEGWIPKNWCFWTVVLEKTLESPLDSKEIKPVDPKRNQLWIFIGRTGAEAEAPILWLPDVKSWLMGKGPDAGKDWGQEEKWSAEDEIVSITDSTDMNLTKLQEIIKNRGVWCATVCEVSKRETWLSNWTTTNFDCAYF